MTTRRWMSTSAPVALPRHRAHEPLGLIGAEEVLARAAQAPRRLLEHRQRARAEQVGLDAVGRALELDNGFGGAVAPRSSARISRFTTGPVQRGSPVAPRCRGASASPRPRARGRARRCGRRWPSQIGARRSSSSHVAGDEHALGGERGGVVGLADAQRVGRHLADAAAPSVTSSCSAHSVAAAGQREPLEGPAEAPSGVHTTRRGTPRPRCRRARPRRGSTGTVRGRRQGYRAPRRSSQLGARRRSSRAARARRAGTARAGTQPDRFLPAPAPRRLRVRAGRLSACRPTPATRRGARRRRWRAGRGRAGRGSRCRPRGRPVR